MTDQRATDPVPEWVSRVAVTAVSVVAAVAAVVSYVHLRTVAGRAGEDWRAYLTPLSVDGLLVAASMVLLVRRREGLRAGPLPWAGLLLGLAASLGANVAAGHPDWRGPWLDGVIAAWPAVALAVAFELLILVARDRQPVTSPAGREGREATRETAREPAPPAPRGPVLVDLDTVMRRTRAGQEAQATTPDRLASQLVVDDVEERDDDVETAAGRPGETRDDKRERLLAEGAGRRRLSRELGISDWDARLLLEGRAKGREAAG